MMMPQQPQPHPLAEMFNNIAPLHPAPQPPPQAPPKTDQRLPIEVMASIQKLYVPPQPMNARGTPGLDPNPGWGGKGR